MPIAIIEGKNILYCHVPKAGGTSLMKWVKTIGEVKMNRGITTHRDVLYPNHLHKASLEAIYTRTMFDTVIMPVRNPVDRILSEYRYQRTLNKYRLSLQFGFSIWLRRSIKKYEKNNGYRNNHFRPQHEFKAWDAKHFKLEDGFAGLREHISEVTGLNLADIPQFGHANASIKKPVKLTQADLDLIVSTYEKDFEIFGYDLPKIET